MPADLSYPGVYIQEVPSGVRTITGVSTSITAFVGRARAGPTAEPRMLTSYADYERVFGGLDLACPMSYAVRDFYRNGGAQALVVRVAGAGAARATITLGAAPNALTLEASSPGTWGNTLQAQVSHASDLALPGDASDAEKAMFFNLAVRYRPAGMGESFVTETFPAVSTDANHPRFLPTVLARDSALVRVQGAPPPARPPEVTFAQDASHAAETGNDGAVLADADIAGGLDALERVDQFNLLCIPPLARQVTPNVDSTYTMPTSVAYGPAIALCVRRRAVLIVDPDPAWAAAGSLATAVSAGRDALGVAGTDARNAALYFPFVRAADPLRGGRLDLFPPSGLVAGAIARTDTTRGVWKAPAGLDAGLSGIQDLQLRLNDLLNGQLNQLGINCLRSFPDSGRVVWGARTMRGSDRQADEYKYLPVRRLALFLEESLNRGTQWVVFEPNDAPLWAQIRLNVGAFMQTLFRQGAFQGASPRDAYFVRCGHDTTTQNDINLGIVNIAVGFAPLRPAEFVVIQIQQMAGQVET